MRRAARRPPRRRVVHAQPGPRIVVEPLRHGDVGTVAAVFERLSEDSRRARFAGPKPRLGARELLELASVDARRHALVAYVEGDPQPVAIARLARDGDSAELGVEVADRWQRRGLGTLLTAELVEDARAAGVTSITAFCSGDNAAALALLRRCLRGIEISFDGPWLWVRGTIPQPASPAAA